MDKYDTCDNTENNEYNDDNDEEDDSDDDYLTAGLRCAPDMGPATRTPIRTPKPLKIIIMIMTIQRYHHHLNQN